MKATTSSFSWGRVAQLYHYYAPWIRKQTTIYFLFSLVTSLLYLLLPSESSRMAVYGPCSTILLFMFIWAPIVFTKGGDTRIVERLIPALPIEKFVFFMSYLFIVIGMACFACPWIAERMLHLFHPGEMGGVDAIKKELTIPKVFEWSQYIADVAAMLTCFYCVVAVKRDRVMKAYLVSTFVLILLSSLNTFYGIKESLTLGFNDAIGDTAPANQVEIAEKVYSAMGDHIDFLVSCMTVSLLYIFLIMWMSYRTLYRRNV